MMCTLKIDRIVRRLVFVIIVMVRQVNGEALRIHGAGASFPLDVYNSWISAYVAHRLPHVKLNMTYLSTGSGEGKARIKGESPGNEPVHYAGSDSLLAEEDYRKYPDLHMFPVMAGPIVIAFNVPGIKSLALDMHHVLGIFNGSITVWNESSLQSINPGVTLPDEDIVVLARSDKSGTTETFTSALSSVSVKWASEYGSFSEGLDTDDKPVHWNSSVVTMFGRTNRGMAGLILSQKYSVGYLSLASAMDAKLPYANLVNSAGQSVVASSETVQYAMNDVTSSISDRMALPLVNAPGKLSYPIAATTYMIISLRNMTNCEVAKELLRYIDWFFNNEYPQIICKQLGMVPLERTLVALVEDRVLKNVTCRGQNVYQMMILQKQIENNTPDVWTIPGTVVGVLLAISVSLVIVSFSRHYLRRQLALFRNEWIIDSRSIRLVGSRDNRSDTSLVRSNKGSESLGSSSVTGSEYLNLLRGKWCNKNVLLRPTCIASVDSISSIQFRRDLLWMRDKITHEHVVKFYGISSLDFVTHLVVEFCRKGSLRDFLADCRFDLDESYKYSASLSIAQGMTYLHNHGILHGYLRASNCFIDADWILKIGYWEKKFINTKVVGCWYNQQDDNAWTRSSFWHAPEILTDTGIGELSKAADVYSFSILLQEIFTREDPYFELKDEMEPDEVINSIKTCALRPVFTEDTPESARQIMTLGWSMDIKERPTFSIIAKMIKKANPQKKTMIDSMVKNLESYVETLEQTVEVKHSQLTAIMANSEAVMSRHIPPSVVSNLLNGFGTAPCEFESVCILVTTVSGIIRLMCQIPPIEVANLIAKVCHELDNVAELHDGVIKLDSTADLHIFAGGISDDVKNPASVVAAVSFDLLKTIDDLLEMNGLRETLALRMGIHTGPCLGSMIGKSCRKFSLIGNTVNQAWKLSYVCKPSRVLISETTWDLLRHKKNYVASLSLPVDKAFGGMKTYWLDKIETGDDLDEGTNSFRDSEASKC